MAGAAGFDWPALMRLGLGRLGLDPARFWALTPMELVIRLGLDGDGRAAMDRDRLEELARAFPDREKGDSTGDRNG
ncbi:MAG TPA: phage tail assembly chaperone [Aliiroseovarius sp.]|nr:phage tail assembly chaperone [Aliiroseovarius sp.]